MSRSARRDVNEKRRPASDKSPAAAKVETQIGTLLETVVAALVVLRLLLPPEGSVLGRTLWVTQFWFAAALLAVWMHLRERTLPRKPDLLDTGVFLVVAAHVASAARVLYWHDGDRRLALNMLWEWLALGVSFVLLRHVISGRAQRAAWQRLMISLAVAISALGLWQHFISGPALVRDYQSMMAEYDALTGEEPGTPVELPSSASERQERFAELRREIAGQQIPTEGPARRMFEDRLVGSTEPVGLFALANTLGGWLAVWLIVGVGTLFAAWGLHSRDRRLALGVCVLLLGLVAYCLVLTKSRTAWVGTLSGAGTGLCLAWRRRSFASSASPRKAMIVAGAVGVTAALLIAIAAMSGGLDRDVFAQAPKSLKYRMQYWGASLSVLKTHWLWGTGPGNFRPHYLAHKWPESSEEIADPHNFLLDLWASGGLLALVGFGVAAAGAVRAARRSAADPNEQGPSFESAWPIRGGWLAIGALLATILLTGGDAQETGRLLGIAAVWEFSLRAFRRIAGHTLASLSTLTAAITALLVHLLGAGGIEMPAITQTLLLLVVLADQTPVPHHPAPTGRVPWSTIAAGAAAMALFVGCFFSATLPVSSREASVSAGDSVSADLGNVASVQRHYERAAVADPFSPEPLERLAELLILRWKRSSLSGSDSDFDAALRMSELVIPSSPHNPSAYRRLGELWKARFERTDSLADAVKSVEWYSEAVARYPNLASLRAARAESMQAAEQFENAAAEAAVALRLDEWNHREGHADKYLPESLVTRLRAIAAPNGSADP